jgi:hypothetical protein
MTTLQLGPITFEESAAAGWSFSDLVDWFGQVDDKVEATERPQAHGAYAVARSLRTSRAISFAAAFLAADSVAVENAFDDLAAVGAEGPVDVVLTTDAGRSARRVSVQVAAAMDHHGRATGQAAVDLIARDPRRYEVDADVSWVQTGPPSAGNGLVWPAVWPLIWPGGGSSGRITLTNRGKAPSAPQFRLYGGFSSALITCVETGARIGLDRVVGSGSVVTVDTAGHTATIDGQSDVSRWLRWREWELVPPGESRTFQFDVTGPSGTPILEGRVLSAWW